jgi:hypothetical protein
MFSKKSWPTPFLAEKLEQIKRIEKKDSEKKLWLVKRKINGKKLKLKCVKRQDLIERIIRDGKTWWQSIVNRMRNEGIQKPEAMLYIYINRSLKAMQNINKASTEITAQNLEKTLKDSKRLLATLEKCPFAVETTKRDYRFNIITELKALKSNIEYQLILYRKEKVKCQKGENQLRDFFVRLIADNLCPENGQQFASLKELTDLANVVLSDELDEQYLASILRRYWDSKKRLAALRDEAEHLIKYSIK